MPFDPNIVFPVCTGIVMAGIAVIKVIRRSGNHANPVEHASPYAPLVVSKNMCDDRYEYLQERLTQGKKDFETLFKEQSKQGKILARMDERIRHLAEKNGIKIIEMEENE